MSTIEETGYDDDIFNHSKYDTKTMKYLRESLFETKNKYDEAYDSNTAFKDALNLDFCHAIIILRLLIVEQYESVSYIITENGEIKYTFDNKVRAIDRMNKICSNVKYGGHYMEIGYVDGVSNFTIEDLRGNDIYKLIVSKNDIYP